MWQLVSASSKTAKSLTRNPMILLAVAATIIMLYYNLSLFQDDLTRQRDRTKPLTELASTTIFYAIMNLPTIAIWWFYVRAV